MNFTTYSDFWNKELSAAPVDPEEAGRILADVVNAAPLAEFSEAQLSELNRHIAAIMDNPARLSLWMAFYCVLYRSGKMSEAAAHDPLLEELGEPDAAAFYLILVIAGIRYGEKIFKSKKWSLAIYYDSLPDIRVWVDDYQQNYHAFGLSWTGSVPWLLKHHSGTLLQFGRLQCYSYAEFYPEFIVLRNIETRRIQVLLDAEYEFNFGGLVAVPGDAVAFKSCRRIDAFGKITAHPVLPDGTVEPDPVTLDITHWDPVLRSRDHVIDLHIPATGPLKLDQCAESMHRMVEFFAKSEPDFKPRAFVCHSWLLDPQLKRLLPATSNLRAFQHAGYMLPSLTPSDVVRRVFGVQGVSHGIDSVPHTSNMQKRLAAFARAGGTFRSGKYFFLIDDLPFGGRNPYL